MEGKLLGAEEFTRIWFSGVCNLTPQNQSKIAGNLDTLRDLSFCCLVNKKIGNPTDALTNLKIVPK